ncbi:MAG: HAD family phosphatase [Clostridiales bacterium]|nr:HAD family phosphatase [Clostridiales bacterium]
MKETYIFDFDGTLVDSMTPAVKVLLEYLDERGARYPDDIVKTIIPLGYKGIADYYVKEFGLTELPQEVYDTVVERLEGVYANAVMAKPEVEKTLAALKARGASLSVLTASPHVFLDPCIKRLGWEKYFDNLWSSDDFEMKKAEPFIYKEAVKRLRVQPSDCFMVDDNVKALSAAKEAGLKTIAVYDSFSKDYEKEMRSFADKYAVVFDEIL